MPLSPSFPNRPPRVTSSIGPPPGAVLSLSSVWLFPRVPCSTVSSCILQCASRRAGTPPLTVLYGGALGRRSLMGLSLVGPRAGAPLWARSPGWAAGRRSAMRALSGQAACWRLAQSVTPHGAAAQRRATGCPREANDINLFLSQTISILFPGYEFDSASLAA